MDRITCRLRPDCIIVEGVSAYYNPKSKGGLSRAVTKLAAYEDTGLAPEEIVTIKKAASGICRFCNNDDDCPADNGWHCEPNWRRPMEEAERC